tara:strand:- start:243 stop:425 length:183 start_codon:yes stop_codon:yes gene_type:complete
MEINPYDKCKKCGFRIGTHSIIESIKCELIKPKINEKKIIYNKEKKRYEYVYNGITTKNK